MFNTDNCKVKIMYISNSNIALKKFLRNRTLSIAATAK